jgi:hypothetical protein
MVFTYIYSTCWCMKSMFYEHQQAPTLGPASISILCLLDLSFASSLRVFNRCLNQLDKDLSPHSGKRFHGPTSFRLQTLWIRVLKGPRLTRLQPKTHRARNATIVDKRVTLLIRAPTHVHVLLWHQKLLQHRRNPALKALLQPKLNRTAHEEEWIKWLRGKLRTSQPWCRYISHQFYSILIIPYYLFFSTS